MPFLCEGGYKPVWQQEKHQAIINHKSISDTHTGRKENPEISRAELQYSAESISAGYKMLWVKAIVYIEMKDR